MDKLKPIHQRYKLYRGVKPLRIEGSVFPGVEPRRPKLEASPIIAP